MNGDTPQTSLRARLRRLGRRALVALLMVGAILAAPSDAYAQKKKKAAEAPKKSYVFPYVLTMMMISLGLMTVCRPGKRKDRPDEIKEDV